jgi:CheY-like chemotaxis protein
MLSPMPEDLTPILGPGGGKILLVEDDVDTRRALDQLLTEVGFEVKCAANGAEAIALLGDGKPQLIMLDIWMPEMSGLEFRARQLSIAGVRDIPVIAMTAAGFREEARVRLNFGRILRKPLDEATVLEAVREFIPGPAALDH